VLSWVLVRRAGKQRMQLFRGDWLPSQQVLGEASAEPSIADKLAAVAPLDRENLPMSAIIRSRLWECRRDGSHSGRYLNADRCCAPTKRCPHKTHATERPRQLAAEPDLATSSRAQDRHRRLAFVRSATRLPPAFVFRSQCQRHVGRDVKEADFNHAPCFAFRSA
jgi:hypothetical protein